MSAPIRYRTVTDFDGNKSRHRVVIHRGFEGFIARWTSVCTGCSEHGEYTAGPDIGSGCHECGYTGKRRSAMFIAFDEGAFMAFEDRRWARRERLLNYWREQKGAKSRG
jgi:hypothetical protein